MTRGGGEASSWDGRPAGRGRDGARLTTSSPVAALRRAASYPITRVYSAPASRADGGRDLSALPKAHLHLHFTGSMSPDTLSRVATSNGDLLDMLLDSSQIEFDAATPRGWGRFQRRYDLARRAVRSEQALRMIVTQAARDDATEGSRRMEIQVDPTSYAPFVDGLANALDIILDAARSASAETGVQVGVIVAASRVRHPLEARTLARLAGRHAGQRPGSVVGFGLNSDENAGDTAAFAPAFRIAERAGLPAMPHGGELRGPEHVRQVVEQLHPTRIGHGVRAVEDPRLLADMVDAGIAFEVCPTSNVHLGVYDRVADVPLRALVDAGARVVLGADDPLLFGSRLTDQYRLAREVFGFSDPDLADLARASLLASTALDADKVRWLAEVDAWLASPPGWHPHAAGATSLPTRGTLLAGGWRDGRPVD